MASNHLESDQAFSGVAQTANVGTSTSVSSGAAKIFREFKWGLLTLFILMAVVVGLVYDGGRNKNKKTETVANTGQKLDAGLGLGELGTIKADDSNNGGGSNSNPLPTPGGTGNTGGAVSGGLGGGNTPVTGGTNDHMGSLPSGNRAHLLEDSADAWSPAPLPNQPIRRPNTGTTGSTRGGRTTDAIGQEDQVTPPDNNGGRQNSQHSNTGRGETRTQPGTTRPTEATGAGKVYVVKAGDSLSKISSSNQLGKNGVKAILDANKDVLTNPDRLREGMKLKIPGTTGAVTNGSEQTQRAPANTSTGGSGRVTSNENRGSAIRPQTPSQDLYVVQAGDSLERIARKILKDGNKWKELMDWNKDKLSDPTKLKVGMTLRTHPGAGGNGSAIPAGPETTRYQNTPVRAENDNVGEPSLIPEAEVAPIPISPVSASKKTRMPKNAENNETPAAKNGPMLPEPDNLNGMLLN